MTNDEKSGAPPSSTTAAIARIAELRVRAPGGTAPVTVELLLSLDGGGAALLALTEADIDHLIARAKAASASGKDRPN